MKHTLSVGILFLVLGLLALSVWYVGSRLHMLFGLASRRMILMGVAVGVVSAAVAMLGVARSASPAVGVLNILGGYFFIFYFFLLLGLIVLHVVQLKWNPPLTWSGVAVLALAFASTGAGAFWADSFVVNKTEIHLPGLKREVTVMHISDVHLGHHRGRAYLEGIVKETNRRRPDLVLITGDLIDSAAALEPGILEPLSELRAPAYFVGGNHEKYVDAQRTFELVVQQGVRVLHNEIVETHGLQLVGLDYMNADDEGFEMHPSDDQRTVKSTIADLPLRSGLPSVLMHHSPVGARYVAAKGVDLMVSGHTHAGQVFPITLFAGLVFPFDRGLRHEGDTAIFVSQGAGTFMARVRLGSSNEINLLHLKPGNAVPEVSQGVSGSERSRRDP